MPNAPPSCDHRCRPPPRLHRGVPAMREVTDNFLLVAWAMPWDTGRTPKAATAGRGDSAPVLRLVPVAVRVDRPAGTDAAVRGLAPAPAATPPRLAGVPADRPPACRRREFSASSWAAVPAERRRPAWPARPRGERPRARPGGHSRSPRRAPRRFLRRVEAHRVLGRDEVEPPLRLALKLERRAQLLGRGARPSWRRTIASISAMIATPPRCSRS